MCYFYPHQHSKLRKQQFSNIGKHKALKCGIEKYPSWSQPTFFILIRANEWIWIGVVLTSSWLDQLSLAQLEAPHKYVYSNLLFRQHTQYRIPLGVTIQGLSAVHSSTVNSSTVNWRGDVFQAQDLPLLSYKWVTGLHVIGFSRPNPKAASVALCLVCISTPQLIAIAEKPQNLAHWSSLKFVIINFKWSLHSHTIFPKFHSSAYCLDDCSHHSLSPQTSRIFFPTLSLKWWHYLLFHWKK